MYQTLFLHDIQQMLNFSPSARLCTKLYSSMIFNRCWTSVLQQDYVPNFIPSWDSTDAELQSFSKIMYQTSFLHDIQQMLNFTPSARLCTKLYPFMIFNRCWTLVLQQAYVPNFIPPWYSMDAELQSFSKIMYQTLFLHDIQWNLNFSPSARLCTKLIPSWYSTDAELQSFSKIMYQT